MRSSIHILAAATLAAFVGSTTAAEKPVHVYILAGQSNMVGIGQVDGGAMRWGKEFTDAEISVYEGGFDPAKDYDKETPLKKEPLASFGGVHPTPFPAGDLRIVRGHFTPSETGTYEFRPGHGDSEHNIMTVGGVQVHRKQPGEKTARKEIKLTGGEKTPFRIIYLTPGANALGWYQRLDVPGTLTSLVKHQGKFPYLIDSEKNWISRDDVWYRGVVTAVANKWLSIGCGAGPSQIGPELSFGHLVGNFHEEPVLLLKASQGNRSLAWDFLPPGSQRYLAEVTDRTGHPVKKVIAGYKDRPDSWDADPEKGLDTPPPPWLDAKGKPIEWYAGKQYDDCVSAAKDVLANFDANFPHWKGRGYEIAGFVWFQGHKDTGSAVTAARYETNLVNLIKALRHDFNAPDAPFVVSTGCGNPGREGNDLIVAEAQLAVGDPAKHPEFKGRVKSVDIRHIWPDPAQSPKNQSFHYHQNAGAYIEIGEAHAKAMLELIKR